MIRERRPPRRRKGAHDDQDAEDFSFRLALALGVWDVDSMRREMSLGLFIRWSDYYDRFPFGEERADWRAGMIASTRANLYRKKGQRRAKPSDYFPKFKARGAAMTRRMSPGAMKQQLKSFDVARKEAGEACRRRSQSSR